MKEIEDFVEYIKQHKPKNRTKARELHLKLWDESKKFNVVKEKVNEETCDVCGEKLIDMSKDFLNGSAHVCRKHGIRPIAILMLQSAEDVIKDITKTK